MRLLGALGARPLALVVDLSAGGADRELLEIATEGARESLRLGGFAAEETPILWGALDRALLRSGVSAMGDLLGGLGAWTLECAARPVRDRRSEPFLMAIEDRFNVAGRRLVVTGRIERGRVRVGDRLVLHGTTAAPKQILGVEMFRRVLDEAHAGDVVGLLLADTLFHEVKRGDLLTDTQTGSAFTREVRAVIHLQDREVCGYTGSFDGVVVVLHLRTACHCATMRLADDPPWRWDRELEHGRTLVVDLTLEEPCWFEAGARFALRVRGSGVGVGVLLKECTGPERAALGPPARPSLVLREPQPDATRGIPAARR